MELGSEICGVLRCLLWQMETLSQWVGKVWDSVAGWASCFPGAPCWTVEPLGKVQSPKWLSA